MAAEGLRERSKARRKTAIIDAALTLFGDRGYDTTTIADIAAAADVSPRTVALYFPSKQDLALAPFSEAATRLVDVFAARTPGVPALTALSEWLVSEGQRREPWDKELCERMFATNPQLAALRAARMVNALEVVGVEVAADLGRDPADPSIQVIVSASAGVLAELASMTPGPTRDTAAELSIRFLQAGLTALR
jgi:AcrR family transcriptional regulator